MPHLVSRTNSDYKDHLPDRAFVFQLTDEEMIKFKEAFPWFIEGAKPGIQLKLKVVVTMDVFNITETEPDKTEIFDTIKS